ncbi:hypothetical protein chiPu_0021666 [Chiloscyllium punctatum]|uniref:Uncharacterized protein n=1 Tax=Chiloscyllium punctatum TaxID=137246 RepID=A0A401RJU6_CHIPU|nr:hypothetical protein [Chiloscyllium punctatum]
MRGIQTRGKPGEGVDRCLSLRMRGIQTRHPADSLGRGGSEHVTAHAEHSNTPPRGKPGEGRLGACHCACGAFKPAGNPGSGWFAACHCACGAFKHATPRETRGGVARGWSLRMRGIQTPQPAGNLGRGGSLLVNCACGAFKPPQPAGNSGRGWLAACHCACGAFKHATPRETPGGALSGLVTAHAG